MVDKFELFKGDGIVRRVSLPKPPPWRDMGSAERHKARAYVPTEEDVRMVNVALHLSRPLLVEGPPGSGKSTLAAAIARELGLGPVLSWPINSRTTLKDGLYQYDAVGRLNDLGWQGAGGDKKEKGKDEVEKYLRLGPLGTALAPSERPRVLLIDEIDKGDLDLPNDLLHVLESGWFGIPELERIAEQRTEVDVPVDSGGDGGSQSKTKVVKGVVRANVFPVVVITSNGERDLPAAFLRRCVRHRMADPDTKRLKEIVEAHLGAESASGSTDLIRTFMGKIEQGEQLAIDQLLNAVFLLSGEGKLAEEEKEKIIESVMKDLNQS